MSKKKEIKQIFENLEVESSDANPKKLEPSPEQPRQETNVPEENQTVDDELLMARLELAAEEEQESAAPVDESVTLSEEHASVEAVEQPGQDAEEESPDDILEDVRRSLLEEEAQVEEERPWWKRIGKSSRKNKVEEETREEINLPSLSSMQTADVPAEASPETEEDEYQEQLDELIDLLDTEDEPIEKDLALTTVDVPPVAPEPEKPVDLDDLKKQVFQSRPVEEEENLTEVRSIALEGDEEVFVEVESKPQDPLEERLSAMENALKPYQRSINLVLAFMGVVMAVVAAFLIYNAYQRSQVQQAPVQEVSNLPYPTSVGLPGGWQFKLGKGSLNSTGNWNPSGAEWLQGTEVCRWVALPWSTQLEAVIRTLNQDDPIELGMSNNDKLTYNVYSKAQMSPEEMRELDSNSPCLLIILAEPGADKRWVLTALP